MKRIFLIFLLLPAIVMSQENPLSGFENLVGKTWMAKGNWGDGSKFKQQITFEYRLENTIVVTNSRGYIDEKRTKLGARNHGIRKFDKTTGTLRFWEYDVFGGITSGTVRFEEKNIFYQYEYGGSTITDLWEYVDDNTYNFKVGSYANGSWLQVYLETKFVSFPSEANEMYTQLKKYLPGNWSSKAWDGILDERWWINDQGNIEQMAEYSENGVVSYRASNTMEIIAGELLLITVIEGSNPKVFKATSFSEDKVVFENSEYKNPNTVTYRFKPDRTFERTIEGLENDQPSSYTFTFNPKQ